MNYFDILAPIVRPILQSFQDDLERHDRLMLHDYTGEFVYGCRVSGTDLFKLEISGAVAEYFNAFINKYDLKTVDAAMARYRESYDYLKIAHNNRNTYFFHGKNGTVKPISQDGALLEMDRYTRKMFYHAFDRMKESV